MCGVKTEMRLRRSRTSPLVVCALLGIHARTDSTGGATELAVRVITAGVDLDSDGYLLDLGGDSSRYVEGQGTTIVQVPPGRHLVSLRGVNENCVAEVPEQVTTRRGERTAVEFDVVCRANVGFAIIRVMTFGDDRDADGYQLSIDDASPRVVGFTEDVQLFDLPVGPRIVTLSGIARNCRLTSEKPVMLMVPFEAMGFAQITLICVRNVGTIVVSAATSGSDIDPDGYSVSLTTHSTLIGANQSVVFSDVRPGNHILTLEDLAANCESALTVRSNRDNFFQIYIMNVDGSNLVRLAQPGASTNPHFSADGSRIIFTMVDGMDSEIYMMNVDGSGTRKVTSNPAFDDGPAWKPESAGVPPVN